MPVCTLVYFIISFLQRLPEQIKERNEKMKEEMMGKHGTDENINKPLKC